VLDLSSLKSLEVLTIGMQHRSTAVLRDEDLACLAGLTRLREFQVAQSVDQPLAFTNRGLAPSAQPGQYATPDPRRAATHGRGACSSDRDERLRMLNVYGGRFTDRGLQSLAQLGRLSSLTLIGEHRFSPAALRRLFEALPDLLSLRMGPRWPGQRLMRERVLADVSGRGQAEVKMHVYMSDGCDRVSVFVCQCTGTCPHGGGVAGQVHASPRFTPFDNHQAEIRHEYDLAFAADWPESFYRGMRDKGVRYERTEFRTDGTRLHSRIYTWAHIAPQWPAVLEKEAHYNCLNFAEGTLYQNNTNLHPSTRGARWIVQAAGAQNP